MAVRLNPNVSEDDLTEAGRRKAAAGALTDEQLRDHLLEKRRKAAEQSTEPPITRPKDRLRPGVDPAILENRRTRGIAEPAEPAACATCGGDDHPHCPTDGVEMHVIGPRNSKGEIPDRRCRVCGLTESAVVAKRQGALLYPLAGFRASMDRAVKASLSTVRDV